VAVEEARKESGNVARVIKNESGEGRKPTRESFHNSTFLEGGVMSNICELPNREREG